VNPENKLALLGKVFVLATFADSFSSGNYKIE